MNIQFPSFKKTFIISAPVGSASGYGERARDLVRQIIAKYSDKYSVKVLPQVWGNTPLTEMPVDFEPLIVTSLTTQPDVWMQVTIPSEFQAIGKLNIGVTAGLEAHPAPAEFVEGINRMDLTLVSSEFSKSILLNSKWNYPDSTQVLEVNKPIEVLFEGIDIDVYTSPAKHKGSKTKLPAIDSIPEKSLFLFVGHWDQEVDRKDTDNLVKVFLETFKNQPNPPALLLKSSTGTYSVASRETIFERIHNIKNTVSTDQSLPNIYLLHGHLTPDEMNAMYKHPKVKCHVTFTHGEGFGRPVLEAAMSGKPMILSPAGGYAEHVPAENAIYLNATHAKMPPSNLPWFKHGATWAQVDYSQASTMMMRVFKHNGEFLERSRKLPSILKSKTLNDMGDKLVDLLNPFITTKPINLPKLEL